MDRDLDPRQALEKGEHTPWRIDGEVNLDGCPDSRGRNGHAIALAGRA